MSQQPSSIQQLITKFQTATNAGWKTRYYNEIVARKDKLRNYYNTLSHTEEQQLKALFPALLK